MAKSVAVKQNSENEIATEVLADSIKAIADGMRKLRAGRLNDKALCLLIQHAADTYGPERGPKRSLSTRDIKALFEGIDSLEATFLRRPASK